MARSYGIGRRIEAVVLLTIAALLRALPVRARIAFGRTVGRIGHRLDRKHRELARRNIRISLGVDEREAARIAKDTFLFFGRAFAESLAMAAYLGDTLDRFVRVEGLEHLQKAYARGKGVIICSAHIGNWELAGLRQCRFGIPMDYISRPLDNPWLYDKLIAWRAAGGIETHTKHGAVRSAMKVLRDGHCLGFVIDQNMTVPPRVFVPFFGRLAATPMTMGHLALRMGAAVVPAYTVPNDDGTYTLRYEPELELPPGDDLDARIAELTLAATRRVEDWIRACPSSWLWLHDRWKTAPGPGELVAGTVPARGTVE